MLYYIDKNKAKPVLEEFLRTNTLGKEMETMISIALEQILIEILALYTKEKPEATENNETIVYSGKGSGNPLFSAQFVIQALQALAGTFKKKNPNELLKDTKG